MSSTPFVRLLAGMSEQRLNIHSDSSSKIKTESVPDFPLQKSIQTTLSGMQQGEIQALDTCI